MAWDWLKNKKYPYVGSGSKVDPGKGRTWSAGWENMKSELGKAFDFVGTKKKKKKDGEENA